MLKYSTRSLLVAGVVLASLGMSPSAESGDDEIQAGHPQTAQQDLPELPIDMRTTRPAEAVPVAHDPAPDPAPPPVVDAADAPLIQVALLLDTSNSMDGLIDQAKAQLWMIVNRFAKAQREGAKPRFQIALFEYGNTRLPAEEGYLRQVVSFTDDLDALSEALFSLRTNGGDEYCGQVIDEALTRLPWSAAGNDFKAIYIAGNEPFTQGRVDYVGVCKRAVDKGVLINTIHCGNEQAGISGKWRHGALLAGGSFLTINQDRAFVHEAAPQDNDLSRLNAKLNTTYIPYGQAGEQAQLRQVQLDEANEDLSPDAGAQRAASKAGGLYTNSNWDLVDASKDADFDLAQVPAEQLPEAMREMTLAQKQTYIAARAKERAEIQALISKLAAQRAEHVAQARADRAEQEGESLGEAVEGTIDEQLEAQGFDVDQKESTPQEQPEQSPPAE